MSYSRMAKMLSPLKKTNGESWLWWFLDDCLKKKNPGAYFWWAVNPENVDKTLVNSSESEGVDNGDF